MTEKYSPFLLMIFLFCVSCDNGGKQQEITEREARLLEKEKLFAGKESEYQSLLKMRDSLFATKDSVKTIMPWPEEISGEWTGKVICNESSCSDYVIGDLRTDTWDFGSDSTQLVVKIINNSKWVRSYSGTYNSNEIKLSYKTDSTAAKQVEMNILLNEISPTKLKGTRTVTVDNKCTAKFSVELSRPSK